MPNKPKLWDAEALNARTQAAIASVESARCYQDWQRATITVERALSHSRGISEFCTLPACRRARRCRGNPTVCLSAGATESASVQAIYRIYVTIQEQRRAAVTNGRKLDMLDPVARPARLKKSKGKRVSRIAQPVIARRPSPTPIGDDRATQ
jgi:hypothetical protein